MRESGFAMAFFSLMAALLIVCLFIMGCDGDISSSEKEYIQQEMQQLSKLMLDIELMNPVMNDEIIGFYLEGGNEGHAHNFL